MQAHPSYLLGGHEDNTVSSTCTIDGSRSILQHGDALHFRRIEVIESLSTEVLRGVAHLHIIRIDIAIDDEQRLLGFGTHVASESSRRGYSGGHSRRGETSPPLTDRPFTNPESELARPPLAKSWMSSTGTVETEPVKWAFFCTP